MQLPYVQKQVSQQVEGPLEALIAGSCNYIDRGINTSNHKTIALWLQTRQKCTGNFLINDKITFILDTFMFHFHT